MRTWISDMMKDWRVLRKLVGEIFENDDVHYYMDTDQIEVIGKSFTMEEFEVLHLMCESMNVWYYVYGTNDKTVIIVERL